MASRFRPASRSGPVFRASEPTPQITRHKIAAADTAGEGARLDAAVTQSRKQLAKLRGKLAVLPLESQEEITPLIDAYIRMLGPSRLLRGVRKRIEETLVSAETAVMEETEAIAAAILAQAEPGMPADDQGQPDAPGRRGARDQGGGWCATLTRSPFKSFAGLPEGAILDQRGVGASGRRRAWLDPARLAGVATEEGGADDHTSVMLRALGVPAVLGAVGLAHAIQPGDLAVVDGIAGTVVLNPDAATLTAAAAKNGNGFRARAAALRQAAPVAGGNDRWRNGGAAGQPGTSA